MVTKNIKLRDNSRLAAQDIEKIFEERGIEFVAQQVFLLEYMKNKLLSKVH